MLVTVYMPAYNYGSYIEEAIESVINQTCKSWELIIINDGSTDNTKDILKKYSENVNIRVINQENKGLNVSNNIGLRLARGKYIMRLDADDYLDSNAIHILSDALENNPEADLSFPDYYEVDPDGNILNLIRRNKLNKDSLLDMPAHGACTLYRTKILKSLGGYLEDFQCQDGYELWIRFTEKHLPININLPLFYYRQHSGSLSKNKSKILSTRRAIKKKYFQSNGLGNNLKSTAIIFASRKTNHPKNDPLIDIAGKKLIDFSLDETRKCKEINEIIVTTPDQDVIDYISFNHKDIKINKRENNDIDQDRLSIINKIFFEKNSKYEVPDLFVLLNINSPLRKANHLSWAIHTLQIFEVDRVISVDEELKTIYQHKDQGLEPVNNSLANLKLERDALFTENGAITIIKSDAMNKAISSLRTSHIVLLPEESVRINSDYEFWLAEMILQKK